MKELIISPRIPHDSLRVENLSFIKCITVASKNRDKEGWHDFRELE